jgi:hypothetical protein
MPASDPKPPVRIDLTRDQRRQLQNATSRDGQDIDLSVEELEERIAPRLSSNHNETLLADR